MTQGDIPLDPRIIRILQATREDWMTKGECYIKKADSSLFILDKSANSRPGKKFCAKCVVRAKCEDYAIRSGSIGLWGGKVFSFKERSPYSDPQPLVLRPVVIFKGGTPLATPEETDFLSLFSQPDTKESDGKEG